MGDVVQGVDSYEEPNAAPAVYVGPGPNLNDDNAAVDGPPTVPGYVQEGVGLDVEIPARDSWAQLRPDVAGGRHTSW